MNNIYEIVVEKLKENSKYLSDDGSILKAKVYDDVMAMDESLLKILLSSQEIKKIFFKKVNDVEIFDKQKFAWFISSNEFLPDSYTRYSNKIGLTVNDKFIQQNNDVVLEFPYKDCLLEGGQTKEDQKRNEIFYNTIIGANQITNLLAPKVFTNFKRYSSNGVENEVILNDNDNLIIKGNNLIAISSLLKRYEGKVNLIYIDPPFNTGKDGFKYNDRFSRSSWLTFMKNRLEIAKKLLSNNGSIFIHIDENQSHYLKVLCDEVLGEENFMNEIVWRYRTYIGQVKDYFPKKHDIIFWYKSKDRPSFKLSNVGNYEDTPDYKRWKNFLNENGEIAYGNHPTTDSRFDAYLRRYIAQFGTPKKGDIIYQNKGYVIDDVWDDIIALDAKNSTERITEFSGSGQKARKIN
jgi:adenine-specific DNA-methyltransferase